MFGDISKLLCNTEPVDKEKAEKAIKELYEYCNKECLHADKPSKDPKIVYVSGPHEAMEAMLGRRSVKVDLKDFNPIAHFVSKYSFGKNDRIDSVIKNVFKNNSLLSVDYLYGSASSKWEKLATAVWDETYACYTFRDVCYYVERPIVVKTNEKGFHCVDGPAIVFRDETEVYCYEGVRVPKKMIECPESITLNDIHFSRNKHILIDLCGVDRYLEMCKEWKPDVKGKLAKFFDFANKTDRHDAYYVNIYNKDVNGKYAFCMDSNYSSHIFWNSIFDSPHGHLLFNEGDKEFWKLLNVEEMMKRGAYKFSIEFKDGIFSLRSISNNVGFASCHHDIAPAWFKAKMFRNQDALYEEGRYTIKLENGKISYDGNIKVIDGYRPKNEDQSIVMAREPLFRGSENIPTYYFDVVLESDSWEGLLEKWANLAFNWLGMHDDSTTMG